jgi:hypothetical protein
MQTASKLLPLPIGCSGAFYLLCIETRDIRTASNAQFHPKQQYKYKYNDRRARLKTQLLLLITHQPAHYFCPSRPCCTVTKFSSHPPIHHPPKARPIASLRSPLRPASYFHHLINQSICSILFTGICHISDRNFSTSAYQQLHNRSGITLQFGTTPWSFLDLLPRGATNRIKEPWIRLQLAAGSNSKEVSSPFMIRIKEAIMVSS